MSRQSIRAAAGRRIITARLTRPLTSGTSQAPRMSRSPGCTHSTVIVVLAAHEPQLSDEFGHDYDHHAREEAVERAPGRKVLEREMGFTAAEDTRQNDFSHRRSGQAGIEPALEPG